jgi:hypothetical protein
LTFFGLRGQSRRFLTYGLCLVAAMAIAGILYPRRLLVFAPWILLAIAVAIGKVQNTTWRLAMALALGLVGAIGWYGVYTHRYYATPRFFEPWQSVADDAAVAARSGATVIGNNPSFFFYLTYALQAPPTSGQWHFSGVLPELVRRPNVWAPEDWQEAGRPVSATVLWVRGMPASAGDAMVHSAEWLDSHCGARTSRLLARDPSFVMKQKFAPEIEQVPWRIEIREYSCGTDDSQSSPSTQTPVKP